MGQGRRTAPLPKDWPHRRERVLRRDRYTCQLDYPGCTVRATEVDHMGAADDHRLDMLQAVCHDCHATKTGRDARAAVRNPWKFPQRRRPPEPHPGLV